MQITLSHCDIDHLNAFRRPIVWTKYSWRTEYWRTNTLKDPAPQNFLVHKGSTHIAAVRGFVGWALYDQRAVDLRDWMRDIRVPDEHFFNTLNHHAHFGVPGAYKGKGLDLGCLMTPGLSKTFSVMYDHTFLNLQITTSDIRPRMGCLLGDCIWSL